MSIKNTLLKQKAIQLRKKGKSYAEILKTVPVAKSTLGLWLKDVGLSQPQQQRLTAKRLAAVMRGGEAKKNQRLQKTQQLEGQAISEIGHISSRELFLIGVVLYWAEGSKQKPHNPSERVAFSNSDAPMIRLFLRWLGTIGVSRDDISFSLYAHDTALHRTEEIRACWSKSLKLRINKFEKVYMKHGSVNTFRKNKGVGYYGQVRVSVAKSTDLNRKINGVVLGIAKNS
jgi:hypothetical protein